MWNSKDNKKKLELFTSQDWMGDYKPDHVDIDFKGEQIFEASGDNDGEVPPLTEGERSEVKTANSNVIKKEAASSSSSTDWMAEYNSMFSSSGAAAAPAATPSMDDELMKHASAPALPDASLAGTSLDFRNKFLSSTPKEASSTPLPKKKGKRTRKKKADPVMVFIEGSPTEKDVLLGRGGRSNHHVGNQRYRSEVEKLQKWYRQSQKNEKTDLSQCLVNKIHSDGGRFLKLDAASSKWFVVPNITARRKASQALREHMTLEEREAMKARKSR